MIETEYIERPRRTIHNSPIELAVRCHVSFKGGSSSGASNFRKTGEEAKSTTFTLPDGLSALIDNASQQLGLDNDDAHNTLLGNLLAQDNTAVPSQDTLDAVQAQTPSAQPWYSNLLGLAQQDPYSASYEADTKNAYLQRLNETLAGLDSATVRSGENHAALMKGQAVADANLRRGFDLAQNRRADTQAVLGSSALLQQLLQSIQGQQLQSQAQEQAGGNQRVAQALEAGSQRTGRGAAAAATHGQTAKLRGTTNEQVSSDLHGAGTQSSSNFAWGTGVSCCFIFMEAYNGPLPWFIRKGRDEFQTADGITGYRRMSRWLIPRMRRSVAWRRLVNFTMVKPIACYGAFRYKAQTKGRKFGWLFRPVLDFWLMVWKGLGR